MSIFSNVLRGPASLLGGGQRVRRPTQSPYRTNQTNTLAGYAPLAGTYNANANAAQGQINKYTPGYDNAVQQETDRLTRDPFTDATRTARMAASTANVGTNLAAGNSRFSAQLARRGIGGNALAGGLALNNAAATTSLIGAGQQEADYERDYNEARPGLLMRHLGGVIAQNRDERDAGYRNYGATLGTMYDGYGDLAGRDEAQEAAYQDALLRQDQNDQAPWLAAIGAAGQYYGGRRAR